MRISINRSILLAFAAALLSICACVPEFSHPLTDEKTSEIDPQLLGRWEVLDEKKDNVIKHKSFWIFSRQEGMQNTLDFRDETLPPVSKNGAKPDTDKTKDHSNAFTTKIGSKHYISIGGVKSDEDGMFDPPQDEKDAYIICRYDISKDGFLTIYFMDQEILGQDVAAKKIPGIVQYSGKRKNHFDNVQITAEPSQIAKYLEAKGDACFKQDMLVKLRRVGEPGEEK